MKRLRHLTALACALALIVTLLPPARAAGPLTVRTAMLAPPTFNNHLAITEDGTLYSIYDQDHPVKIGSGYVSVGYFSAVTQDGSLYRWENADFETPEKKADNVYIASDLEDGECFHIKKDGALYNGSKKEMNNVIQISATAWDPDQYAVTADGGLYYQENWSAQGQQSPKGFLKVLDGVAAISGNGSGMYYAMIKTDGSLWVWGMIDENDEESESLAPSQAVKVMGNVVCVDAAGLFALSADGTLYELGLNGDLESAPSRLMDGVVCANDGMILKEDGSLWTYGNTEPLSHKHTGLKKVLDGVRLPGSASNPGTPSQPEKPAEPETPVKSNLMTGSASLSQLDKQEIIDLLANAPLSLPSGAQSYDIPPSTNPNQAGKLSDLALQAPLNRLNALRRIAGLPPAALDRDWSDAAQHGAFILALLNDLTHTPSQPAGMDNAFYDKAYAATNSSNISCGSGLISAVDGWMDDSDGSNVDRLGHRRWQLSPALTKVGFGFVSNTSSFGNYAVEKVFERGQISASHSVDYDSFGWPCAGYFPNDTSSFGAYTAWNVSLNPSIYAAPSGITVRLSGGGKSWTLSGSYRPASEGAYLNVITSDGWNYGANHCIIFRPDGVTKYEGVYTVEIEGLKHKDGSAAPFTYTVEFFSTAPSTQPSKPTAPDASGGSGSGSTTPKPTTPSATAPNPTTTTGKSNPFTDVPDNAYYKDAVLWALENGVTTGVTATEFRPSATCTRGQVVTFLWRAKGCPEPKTATNPFRDVSASSPFYKAILWAQENGITSGTTATTFNPGGTCTSGHVVTFLWRANDKPAASGSSSLASANPGKYYTDAVAWADAAGLLNGVGAAFNPSNRSPRADIVTYLYRDLAG